MKKDSLLRSNLGVRLGIIALLIIGLLIPAMMVMSLISDRESYRDRAISDVSEKWGQRQQLAGPMISVPYEEVVIDNNNRRLVTTHYAHFLPDQLTVNGTVAPEIRYRGIYEIVLYQTNLLLEAEFDKPNMGFVNVDEEAIRWKDAFLSIGISDMKGINELVEIHWNDSTIMANPGIESRDVLQTGISCSIDLSGEVERFQLKTSLNLNGSEQLMFTPVGKENNIAIKSDWPSPSFAGASLPDSREVSENGFSADWKVLHLNRNYPQSWIDSRFNFYGSEFGVDLMLPVDHYQKTMRTSKYAIMFIVLTFTAFFLIELLNRKLLHPIQYLLVGLALLVFYTLLLSFSEHIYFGWAYLISAVAIIGLITGYAKAVLGDLRLTGMVFGVLGILYGYLYIVLQLEDLALLMGSIGLFAVLAVVMYLTRKIDWYGLAEAGKSKAT